MSIILSILLTMTWFPKARSIQMIIESMLPHGVTKVNQSAERTFRWAWCCGNDGQNGRHLRELWCNCIKAAFMQLRQWLLPLSLLIFRHVFSWIDLKGVGLPKVAHCRNYSNQQLQWATKVVETLLGKDAFRYLSICSILFASGVTVKPSEAYPLRLH